MKGSDGGGEVAEGGEYNPVQNVNIVFQAAGLSIFDKESGSTAW